MSSFPITKEGFVNLEAEIKDLKTVQRPQIIKAIASARELGDLSENAEYHAAREKQSFIEGRILELEDKVARADVIDVTKLDGDKIKFGATIEIIDLDDDKKYKYQIVGEYEADLSKGRISITSPIARSLIGKSVGQFVEVVTPKAEKEYEIVSVEYK